MTRRISIRLEELEARTVPTFFNVGPGQAYASLHEVPWDLVTAGDTVRVYWQETPYHDKIQLGMRGNPVSHIRIVGVPGADGQLPVIDANGAIENPQADYYSNDITAQAIFTIAPAVWDQKPGWIDIQNLELENATRDNIFYRADGTVASWNWGAAGIAMYQAEHIFISGCNIHDNEDGLFGKSNGYELSDLRDIVVDHNIIERNGRPYQDHYHNTYIEAIGITYQFNYFGEPIDWSAGLNVKDRSAGLIFRYNQVVGGNTLLDLVEPQDGDDFLQDPLWGKTFVYGNILVNPPYKASAIVHFGGDNGNLDYYQKNLYFFNNTVVDWNSYPDGRWRTIIFDVPTNDQEIFAFNNILYNTSPLGEDAGRWCIAEQYGTFHLGTNWINSGYLEGRDGVPFYGSVDGEEHLVTGFDPGFKNADNWDFRLHKQSPCRGVGDAPVPDTVDYPVDYQLNYASNSWVARQTTGDLGAIEHR
jgi:hypothetical protein